MIDNWSPLCQEALQMMPPRQAGSHSTAVTTLPKKHGAQLPHTTIHTDFIRWLTPGQQDVVEKTLRAYKRGRSECGPNECHAEVWKEQQSHMARHHHQHHRQEVVTCLLKTHNSRRYATLKVKDSGMIFTCTKGGGGLRSLITPHHPHHPH